MTQPGDSFAFHGDTTMYGPAAFGTGAQAWTGSADAAWRAQLLGRLAEFRAEYERSKPTLEPSVIDGIEAAYGDVTDSLGAQPFNRATLVGRVKQLAVVASTVGGLAAAIDRIRELVS